jgi:osomolarity two-component system sensor histidine kinase SLN1
VVAYDNLQSERRLYILQDRLIMQNKQTLQAQKNERAAADSKRRLTSYVFHEVRVPLNTAVLAAQNVHASLGAAAQTYKVEFTALSGSLNQMSAVLNDILDFNRMESGKFAFVAQPFAFHTTMRSLFSPLRLSAEARNLRFVTNLDADIDNAALKTTLETIHGVSTEVGVFVGDEQRLRLGLTT